MTSEVRISGYFCSDTVFNLSHRILTETETKVLEKGLDYASIQKEINELELRKVFSEFYWRMRNRWYFRNEPTPKFSEVPCFKTKSSWKPPNGRPALEIFLSKVEKIYVIFARNNKHTLTLTVRIGIKKADKRSCVVVWGRKDYLMKAEKQLSDKNV